MDYGCAGQDEITEGPYAALGHPNGPIQASHNIHDVQYAIASGYKKKDVRKAWLISVDSLGTCQSQE